MNPSERLLALYDRVAEAPEAGPRLHRFVLDLAVRGKLVKRNPSDAPVSELLERIAMGKIRLAHPHNTRGLVPCIVQHQQLSVPATANVALDTDRRYWRAEPAKSN